MLTNKKRYLRTSLWLELKGVLQTEVKEADLKEGDQNTSYFFAGIAHKRYSWAMRDGRFTYDQQEIGELLFTYFSSFLGLEAERDGPSLEMTLQRQCLGDHRAELLRPFTIEKTKRDMFSFANNNSPHPDGYGNRFYKETWEIRINICAAVQDFFDTG